MAISYDTGSAVTAAANTLSPSTTGFTTATDNELIVAFCAAADNVSAVNLFYSSNLGSASYHQTYREPQKDAFSQFAYSSTTTGADTAYGYAYASKMVAGATGDIFCEVGGTSSRHVVIAGAFKIDQKSLPPHRKLRHHQHMMVR